MSINITAATVLYKLACLAVGFGLSYLGFQLFMKGLYEKTADLTASFGDLKIILKKASPGIFFALFGSLIISFTIYKGMAIESVPSDRTQDSIITSEDKLTAINIVEFINTQKPLTDIETKKANALLERIINYHANKGQATRGLASPDKPIYEDIKRDNK